MKSILFFIIVAIANVSLLPFATSTQPMATGIGNHQLQSNAIAVLATRHTVSSPALPDLTPVRGKSHDIPLERGTILLFGIGLIALSFQWKFRGGNR